MAKGFMVRKRGGGNSPSSYEYITGIINSTTAIKTTLSKAPTVLMVWMYGGSSGYAGCREPICLIDLISEKILTLSSAHWGPATLSSFVSGQQYTTYTQSISGISFTFYVIFNSTTNEFSIRCESLGAYGSGMNFLLYAQE